MDPMDIETTVTQARDEFDLGSHLRGKKPMTGTVKVFTDKETGAELGGVEYYETRSDIGLRERKLRTWGLTGEIVKLSATEASEKENAEEITRLKGQVVELAAKLDSTAITLNLRSLPPEIKKDAKRAARKHLGINGKLNPEDERWEDFSDEWDAQLLQRCVVTWTLHEKGETIKGMKLENARALKSYLEDTEFQKIQVKLGELLWQRQISDKAVEDADFSHGI